MNWPSSAKLGELSSTASSWRQSGGRSTNITSWFARAGFSRLLVNRDADHLHGRLRTVATVGGRGADLGRHVLALDDLGKHRVTRGSGREPIEVGIVHGVDEELTGAAVGT